MAKSENSRSDERTRAAISAEIAAIHADSYGAAVGATETHLLDDFVLTLVELELTATERLLLSGGRGEAVQAMRGAYEAAIAATFTAVVERETGRRVDLFVSHTHLEPPLAVELFRLAPARAPLEEPWSRA